MALTLRNIDDELRAALEREAGARGLSLNSLIIELCRTQLGFAPAGIGRHYDLDASDPWSRAHSASFWRRLAQVRGCEDADVCVPGFPLEALSSTRPGRRQPSAIPSSGSSDYHTVARLKTSLEMLGRRRLRVYRELQHVLDGQSARVRPGRKRADPSDYEIARPLVEGVPPLRHPRYAGTATAELWSSVWSNSGPGSRRFRLVLAADAYAAYRMGCPVTEDLLATAEHLAIDSFTLAELRLVCALAGIGRRDELERFLGCPRLEVTPVDGALSHRFASLAAEFATEGETHPAAAHLWPAASAFQTGGVVLSYDKRYGSIPGLLVLPQPRVRAASDGPSSLTLQGLL